jgi:hypothetical protein
MSFISRAVKSMFMSGNDAPHLPSPGRAVERRGGKRTGKKPRTEGASGGWVQVRGWGLASFGLETRKRLMELGLEVRYAFPKSHVFGCANQILPKTAAWRHYLADFLKHVQRKLMLIMFQVFEELSLKRAKLLFCFLFRARQGAMRTLQERLADLPSLQ